MAVGKFDQKEVQVYVTNGLFLSSFGKVTLEDVHDMTATNSADSKIMVLEDWNNEICVQLFTERGDLLSQIEWPPQEFQTYFHHAREFIFVLLAGCRPMIVLFRILLPKFALYIQQTWQVYSQHSPL